MSLLTTIRDEANARALAHGDNQLSTKFTLATSIDIPDISIADTPMAIIWLGPNLSTNDTDDNNGVSQAMNQEIKVWLVGRTEDLYELISDCNRAILGIQPTKYLTPLVHSSGYLKEVNGAISWFEMSYQFTAEIRSE